MNYQPFDFTHLQSSFSKILEFKTSNYKGASYCSGCKKPIVDEEPTLDERGYHFHECCLAYSKTLPQQDDSVFWGCLGRFTFAEAYDWYKAHPKIYLRIE